LLLWDFWPISYMYVRCLIKGLKVEIDIGTLGLNLV